MLRLLAGVGDAGFVRDACLRLRARTLDETRGLLRHARARDALLRLGTWCGVGPAGFDAGAWQSFRAADLAAVLRAFVARGDVARAAVVWRRHAGGDARLRGDVASALHAFPADACPGALAQWLRREVLPRIGGGAAAGVGAWLGQRARALEAAGRLRDAVRLALLAHEAGGAGAAGLHAQLAELAHLQRRHALALRLDAYAQLSFAGVARLLLDRTAAAELLPAAYAAHFAPYARRHALDPAALVRAYCADAMAAQRHWEPRVLALLACVADAELAGPSARPLTAARLGALHAVGGVLVDAMRRSDVPWSAALDAAIGRTMRVLAAHAPLDSGVELSRAAASEQLRLMRLRRMLLRHGLASFHVSNTRMAGPLLHALVRAPAAGAMRDVLQLVDAYHHLARPAA
ncbi:hypothetical protein LPJ66_012061, partial [Kickxella alabastrina]